MTPTLASKGGLIYTRDFKHLLDDAVREQEKLDRTNQQEQNWQSLQKQLRDKPFWIWNNKHRHKQEYRRTKGQCCFNHIIGLPSKIGRGKLPLFPYEKEVVDALENHGLVFIVKATGLGISELALRYIAWLCTRNNDLTVSQIVIITGPRIELTISLLNRFKGLFPNI